MFDKDTLIVAYDIGRGEPRSRGKKRKQDAVSALGDCIDCGLCVQVCPTGIDIRDGLQYECIACAACIDACDEVMERVDLPKGLIHYSTELHDQGVAKSLVQTIFRPRIILYTCLLVLLLAGFVVALAMRANFQVDIMRDRNALYRWSEQDQIENSYQLKIMNKSQLAQRYVVEVEGLQKATVSWASNMGESVSPLVEAGEIGDFTAIVTLPPDTEYARSQSIELVISETEGETLETVREETRFWGPARNDRAVQ